MTEGADRVERAGDAGGRVDEAVLAYIDGIADDEFRDLARAALEA